MQGKIRAVPTLAYPESDGKPMAETDAHRDLILDCIETLKQHFKDELDVYVSGNLLIYYPDGMNAASVAPDVFVVRGVPKKRRRIYVTREENNTPDFVLEVASRSTYARDLGEKKQIYASKLAVQEYYVYVPYGMVESPFVGFRLVGGEYREIDFVNERLQSDVLGLELGEHEGELRFYNPLTEKWLQPPQERADAAEEIAEAAMERAEEAEDFAEAAMERAEQEARARQNAEELVEQEARARQDAEERAEQEARARQDAEERAEQEARARQNAEVELAKALAELKRLQAETES